MTPGAPDRETLTPPGRRRRPWVGRLAYALLFLLVVGGFVALFAGLTGNWRVALVSVAGMLAYMLLAAKLASRDDARGGGGGGFGLG